jgi:hypothetical protein
MNRDSSHSFNIKPGSCYSALMLWIASNYPDKWLTFAVLFAIAESIITAMIVWYAWKCPGQGQLY